MKDLKLKKSKTVIIRLRPELWDFVKREADRRNVSISEYVRTIVERELQPDLLTDKAACVCMPTPGAHAYGPEIKEKG